MLLTVKNMINILIDHFDGLVNVKVLRTASCFTFFLGACGGTGDVLTVVFGVAGEFIFFCLVTTPIGEYLVTSGANSVRSTRTASDQKKRCIVNTTTTNLLS